MGLLISERQESLGGMATVYLAVDLKHERKVAPKVLTRERVAVVWTPRRPGPPAP